MICDDPMAFLQHDVHAEAAVDFFPRTLPGKRRNPLPTPSITLKVHPRFDLRTTPAAVTKIHVDVPDAICGHENVCFNLYNRTGGGTTGYHYDPLMQNALLRVAERPGETQRATANVVSARGEPSPSTRLSFIGVVPDSRGVAKALPVRHESSHVSNEVGTTQLPKLLQPSSSGTDRLRGLLPEAVKAAPLQTNRRWKLLHRKAEDLVPDAVKAAALQPNRQWKFLRRRTLLAQKQPVSHTVPALKFSSNNENPFASADGAVSTCSESTVTADEDIEEDCFSTCVPTLKNPIAPSRICPCKCVHHLLKNTRSRPTLPPIDLASATLTISISAFSQQLVYHRNSGRCILFVVLRWFFGSLRNRGTQAHTEINLISEM